jgi:predicted metal-binding membrane protein
MGCCWLLMATGLAMGVMNLAWMAVLTVVIAAEQVLPHGERVAGILGLAMAAWGIALFF